MATATAMATAIAYMMQKQGSIGLNYNIVQTYLYGRKAQLRLFPKATETML
jgi:hypothetical protein